MVLPAIPVILAGAAKALGSAAVRKMLKQGVSQAVIRKKGAKEASKKAFKKLRRQQRERASDQRFEGKSAKEMDRMMREEEEEIRSIAEGGMRNPRLFGLKMQAGGRVKSKEKLANIETSTQKRKRKAPPSVQRALDANKGKSKATITKGIYKRLAKDRGIEYPKRRGSAKSGSAGGLKPSTILEGKLPGKKRMKAGGLVKKMDGIAIRGKTKGRIV